MENNILPNLIDNEVKIDSSIAIIDLYRTIYNGRRLRDMFGIISKLKDRIPAGADINSLIYLSVVDSKVLPEKEGKKRESDFTCVIMDDPRNPKYMVELDETILKPRENLSKQENITADNTSEHLGDGEIKSRATTTTSTRQITTFDIPGAEGEIGQTNDLLTLEIRKNSKYIDESTTQRNDAHNTEIYLGVQDRSRTENEQQHGLNTQSIKLEAYDETARIEEFNMREEIRTDHGVDDEFENIKGVNGIDRGNERDAVELNGQMKEEEKGHIDNVNKQFKENGQATAEVAAQVNERERYMKMAESIAKDNNTYGANDVYAMIMKVKNENQELSDEQLEATVQQQLEGERVLGENPRRM